MTFWNRKPGEDLSIKRPIYEKDLASQHKTPYNWRICGEYDSNRWSKILNTLKT